MQMLCLQETLKRAPEKQPKPKQTEAEAVRHTLHICCNIHKLSASYKRIILRADNTDSLTPSRLDNELLQGQIYLS